MCIHVTLPYPPSANRYWRTVNNTMVRSEEANKYKHDSFWVIREQMGGPVDLVTGPIAVTLEVYRPRRSGDLDNRIKVAMDSIQGSLIVDDSQIVELHAYRLDDKKNPRIELTIEEVKAT